MKKLLIATAFLSFVSVAANAQVKDPATRKELKEVFYKECITNTESKPGEESYASMKKFCECSADKVMDKFTEEELGEMNSWDEEKMTNTLQPVIKGCMEKLEEELKAIYGQK